MKNMKNNKITKTNPETKLYDKTLKNTEMIFFSYLTDFSYFPLNFLSERCRTLSEYRSKIDLLKGGVDCFSFFFFN
jgi:hypothetical protein